MEGKSAGIAEAVLKTVRPMMNRIFFDWSAFRRIFEISLL